MVIDIIVVISLIHVGVECKVEIRGNVEQVNFVTDWWNITIQSFDFKERIFEPMVQNAPFPFQQFSIILEILENVGEIIIEEKFIRVAEFEVIFADGVYLFSFLHYTFNEVSPRFYDGGRWVHAGFKPMGNFNVIRCYIFDPSMRKNFDYSVFQIFLLNWGWNSCYFEIDLPALLLLLVQTSLAVK